MRTFATGNGNGRTPRPAVAPPDVGAADEVLPAPVEAAAEEEPPGAREERA